MGEDPRPLMDNSSQRGPLPMMRPPRGPFGPRGPPPGFRPRHPGDWGPRGPPPGMFGPRGHPPFGPRGPPPEWALRGPHPDFFRPRGPMDGPFRGPHGEFGPRGEKFPGEFSDFRGLRPDMFMGPRPFGMRPIGPADNGQFAEDDFGSADFNGLPSSAEGQQKKKKSKKKKKSSADDAKFPTQKAKDPVKAEDKENGKDGEESDVDEDKLLASDDEDDSSSSSSSDSSDGDDTDNKGDCAPQLPMQAGGSRPAQRPPFRPPFSHINRFPGNQRFPSHQRFPGPRFPGQRFHRPPSNQQEPRIVNQPPPPRVVMADGSLQRPAVIQQPLHQSPQSVQIMQPGQVLVRQVIPGLAQPVLRAVTLQPGQVLPGQLPGQHVNIQNIAAMRPATTLLQQQQQQQHNLQLLIQHRNVTPTSAGHVSGETTNGTEARLPKQLGGLQVANPGQVIAPGLNQPQFSNTLPGQQRPTLLPTPNALQTQLRPNAAGGQPMFIPSSGATHGHPGQNLNATLQASQALILQQQQQLAAVQQQQLALQQQHQQQLLQQQQQQEYERRAQDQQRPDGKMLRPDARDNRRKRDDYHRSRRYNRSRSRSFSRSRSNSWSGSDSRSRSRSSRSRSGSRSLSGSRSRSRSWSSAEGSRSPSPQRRKGGRERYDQNARSSERYGRQNSQQHRMRGEQKHSYTGKDEQKYEELERQRLKERERRDRERDRDGGREKDYIPSKRRRDDRDGDGRDQMQDGRSNESRARRDERKDSSKSSARDHNTSKDQSRASSNPDIGNRVLISSLPASMSERKLKQLMQSVGEVENLKLSTTRHKALVAFTRSSTAVACRKKFHKYVIDNCKLLVEFA